MSWKKLNRRSQTCFKSSFKNTSLSNKDVERSIQLERKAGWPCGEATRLLLHSPRVYPVFLWDSLTSILNSFSSRSFLFPGLVDHLRAPFCPHSSSCYRRLKEKPAKHINPSFPFFSFMFYTKFQIFRMHTIYPLLLSHHHLSTPSPLELSRLFGFRSETCEWPRPPLSLSLWRGPPQISLPSSEEASYALHHVLVLPTPLTTTWPWPDSPPHVNNLYLSILRGHLSLWSAQINNRFVHWVGGMRKSKHMSFGGWRGSDTTWVDAASSLGRGHQ